MMPGRPRGAAGAALATPPIILLVDDEPAALSLTERELSKRYGGDYRIVARDFPRPH